MIFWLFSGNHVFKPKGSTAGVSGSVDDKSHPLTVETIIASHNATLAASWTATPTITITPSPTITPSATMTPALVEEVSVGYHFQFGYSYYYPDLGGANCDERNWDASLSRCADSTSSGQTWRDKLGQAVAIPIQYSMLLMPNSSVPWCVAYHLPCIPFGSVISIPTGAMSGDWLVIDTCGDCIKNNVVYIDFLDVQQRLDWGSPIDVFIKLVP